jgi:hypothetical protein
MAISKLSAAFSILAVFSSAEAKKRPYVLYGDSEEVAEEPQVPKTHEKKVRAPSVKASGDAMCLFKDTNNSWCFADITPMLESGWEVYQDYGDGEWNV